MSGDDDTGGRYGRTPYLPDDLMEQFETAEKGTRLAVECPGCGREWYPSAWCVVNRRAGSPFCPTCGTDFRLDHTDDLQRRTELRLELSDVWQSCRAQTKLKDGDEAGARDDLEALVEGVEDVIDRLEPHD